MPSFIYEQNLILIFKIFSLNFLNQLLCSELCRVAIGALCCYAFVEHRVLCAPWHRALL